MELNSSASQILSNMVLDYLKLKATENGGAYEFERNEVVIYLNENWQDERNTPGAQTGALNRLFDSSSQITKIAHGKYIYHNPGLLNVSSINEILKDCHLKIDKLSTNFIIEKAFTKHDRKLIARCEHVLNVLEELLSEFEKKES